jgi:hypothetical protein
MAELERAVQQIAPDSGFVDLGFSERTIHNVEAWRKLGLLSEEIYLQHMKLQKKNHPETSHSLTHAIDKFGDYIIKGLSSIDDIITVSGKVLQKAKNTNKKEQR